MRKNIAISGGKYKIKGCPEGIINTPEGVYIGWDVKSIEEWDVSFNDGDVLIYGRDNKEFKLLSELWDYFKKMEIVSGN